MKPMVLIKENIAPRPVLSTWWLLAGLALSMLSYAAVSLIDQTLPEPLTRDTADKEQFIAEIAHEHLVNLTSIGARVAGSYENEVLSVAMLVEALKKISHEAHPHHRVEIDVHTASGGFPLKFFDGLNNLYRDVSMVVARVSAAGARPASGAPGGGGGGLAGGRVAVLLNCHYDTVPDSPGASDDGAGCCVMLETLRALVSRPRPLPHDAVFLFNGAEENIMQASHAFITTHKWAKGLRAFINIEACGAGGRELLFQAGPHDPWIMETYASTVPHPFASSLAQELFESGLVPGDTDFRIFRDFGNISGVDLAWSSNGYVYHTQLDTADRVPPQALQRTGDNVLALLYGLLWRPELPLPPDRSGLPVYFDVLGAVLVSAAPATAALVAVATLLLLALSLHLDAKDASRELYMGVGAWWRAVLSLLARAVLGAAAGAVLSVLLAVALEAAGAGLAFYDREWLIVPLCVVPGVCCCWAALASWRGAGAASLLRGWAAWRAGAAAVSAGGGALLAGAAMLRLRSGFVPLLCALPPAVAALATRRARPCVRAAWWAAAWQLGAVQACYLARPALHMFVPVLARTGPAPAHLLLAALVSVLSAAGTGWLLPAVLVVRRANYILWLGAGVTLLGVLAALSGDAYSPQRPQRVMLFHTRRTVHAPSPASPHTPHQPPPPPELYYWAPQLDTNTLRTLHKYVEGGWETGGASCDQFVYCGLPYYLPVRGLVPRGWASRAQEAPAAVLHAALTRTTIHTQLERLTVNVSGTSHIVLILSPVKGAHLSNVSALAGPPRRGEPWGDRDTYFFSLFSAKRPNEPWLIDFDIKHSLQSRPQHIADVSVSGHCMAGACSAVAEHRALQAKLPAWTIATGWGVDTHIYTV